MGINQESVSTILQSIAESQDYREDLYKYFHQHPELSMQEKETSARIIAELTKAGLEPTRVGKTGVVVVLRNGEGPTVAMRADFDALPVKEASGKDYASTATQVDESTGKETPVAHACGHDVHIMGLLGACLAFHEHRDAWSGTFVGVFQPGEETAAGARDMVEADIASAIPTPDVYLGQHVLGVVPGGYVGTKPGPVFSTAKSIKITLHGAGSHGSMPELGVDPVLLASTIVVRLQSIVSREIAANQTAVLTVGSIQSGSKSNIIPDDAVLLLNTRAFDEDVADHLHEAIERTVRGECTIARCPREPEFEYYDAYPLTDNDPDATATVRDAFDAHFGDASVDMGAVSASEDFSIIADALGVPYCYWGLGGFADYQSAPGNHSPAFAPDLQPTLDRAAEAAVVAASAWLTA